MWHSLGTTLIYWAKPSTSPQAPFTPGSSWISFIFESGIFFKSKETGPCPPLPAKSPANSSCTGFTTKSIPSYIPENKLSKADLLLSENILDAIITATPNIIEDVVSSIRTGYVFKFFQAIRNSGLFVKPYIYISVNEVTCETISS